MGDSLQETVDHASLIRVDERLKQMVARIDNALRDAEKASDHFRTDLLNSTKNSLKKFKKSLPVFRNRIAHGILCMWRYTLVDGQQLITVDLLPRDYTKQGNNEGLKPVWAYDEVDLRRIDGYFSEWHVHLQNLLTGYIKVNSRLSHPEEKIRQSLKGCEFPPNEPILDWFKRAPRMKRNR
ncbi:MAG: hypothetical protein AAF631_08705 [Pseudomonadota bacterium]